MQRYQRQIILEEIGIAGQEKLRRASVLVVGAGGLGCPALLYLAAAGVGRLGIADFDRIDESNLQRQILFENAQAGMAKVEAARDKLRALNPKVQIEIYPDGLSADNVESLFNAYDVIIDGTDNFESKHLINDAGVKFSKPVIYGAINKFEGQVAIFDAAHGACYRCLYPQAPEQHIPNCAEAGVLGAVAGITGTMQAMQAIMLIVGHENFVPLVSKFWSIDTRTLRTRLLDIRKDHNCPVCSKKKEEIILSLSKQSCAAITEISVQETKAKKNPLLYDVREQDEWDAGHIAGATLMPLSQLLQGDMPELPHTEEIIFYCRSGKRSHDAAMLYAARGYTNIKNMTGGYLAWHNGT